MTAKGGVSADATTTLAPDDQRKRHRPTASAPASHQEEASSRSRFPGRARLLDQVPARTGSPDSFFA